MQNAIGNSGGIYFSRIKICYTVDKEKVIFFILTGQIKNSVLR